MSKIAILSEEEVERIHGVSLRLLKRVGVGVPHEGILAILADGGAEVDAEKQVARLPSSLVERALEESGKNFILHGRGSEKHARFGYGDFVLVSSPGQFSWVEEGRVERRSPTLEDARRAIRIGDALENITLVGAMAVPQEIPAPVRDIHLTAELVKGTAKPTWAWVGDGNSAEYVLEICNAVTGGWEEMRKRPMILLFVEPISPLGFSSTGLEIFLKFAKKGLPVMSGPMVMASATGPATIAGTLALENAEILASLVIAQLIYPGVPFCYGGIPHIMDQRKGTISFGSPEQILMAVAMTQMGKFYGFPVYINVGLTDSKLPDAQAGLEKGASLILGAMSGADTFGHQGIVGADQAASLEQLVIDDEIASFVKRVIRGFQVDKETLAEEVIARVGIGGNFLMEEHTLRHFRQELWFPRLCDRSDWDSWRARGGKSMAERARQRKEELLRAHEPEPIDENLEKEIDSIVETARRHLIGEG